jgi:hypothetical protein
MIQSDLSIIGDIVLHHVAEEESKSILSNDVTEIGDDDENALFRRILLKPFATHTSTFEFTHAVDIEYNVLFKLAKAVFEEADFLETSKDIARHLISVSTHPNIKPGDLFMAKFDDVGFGGKHYRALGIYKFEDKDSYLETSAAGKQVKYTLKKGIGGRKADKACLILFTDEPYTLFIIDNSSADTDYWQNAFIKHKPKNDFVNNTNDVMGIARNFITEEIPQIYQVTKADQIDFMNRSVAYFKTHETFDKKEFEQEVFHHDDLIKSFQKFDKNYREENDLEIEDSFEISQQSVKKQARVFKSVLKLDKNFHIYIHGNREMIEQGVDNQGRKYYKIYYEEES